jgi:hypothetical protein
MDTVSQIPQPGLQVLTVVLADERSVRDDVGCAADRSPLPRGVEKTDVDVRITVKVVCLAGFSIGMEKEIDAAVFLRIC